MMHAKHKMPMSKKKMRKMMSLRDMPNSMSKKKKK